MLASLRQSFVLATQRICSSLQTIPCLPKRLNVVEIKPSRRIDGKVRNEDLGVDQRCFGIEKTLHRCCRWSYLDRHGRQGVKDDADRLQLLGREHEKAIEILLLAHVVKDDLNLRMRRLDQLRQPVELFQTVDASKPFGMPGLQRAHGERCDHREHPAQRLRDAYPVRAMKRISHSTLRFFGGILA